jgi:acyl dehydratase
MTSLRPEMRPLPELNLGERIAPAVVTAFNNSLHSDNKIHDDAVARTYGFKGGLVPGVTVYAYMAAPLAAALGERWLSAGSATVALVQPLYEGEQAVASAEVTAVERRTGRVTLDAWVEKPNGVRCAVGSATVPTGEPAPAVVPDYVRDEYSPLPVPPPALLLDAAPAGAVLAPLVVPTSKESAREYAQMVFDFNPLFSEGSSWGPALLHPGWLLSECNTIFRRNFSFGPWIHTKSEIQYLGPALAGSTFEFHGRLLEVYEKRGHHYASVDVFCRDDAGNPVMQARHTAIFRIRMAG